MLDRLQDAELKLGPMNADELRSTIEGPAARAGLTIGQPLVDHLLADARDEPGRLPLLEFALKELWLRRERFELTETAYHDLGWLRGAIAKRADAAYDNLCEDEQKVLPQLFRQLVRVGEKSDEDTRRRAELVAADELQVRAVNKLAAERLLVTSVSSDGQSGKVVVEVAHEELLRQWSRLKQWVDQDRQFLQWRKRLESHVEDWHGYGNDALLKGELLREATGVVADRQSDLNQQEIQFIEASVVDAVQPSFEAQTGDATAVAAWYQGISREGIERTLRQVYDQPDAPTSVKRRCAVTGLTFGFAEFAAELTQVRTDPARRTDFIHQWNDWPADIISVIDVLSSSSDGALQSAICCALGAHELDAGRRPGDPGRQLGARRPGLPFGGPPQERAGAPERCPGLSCGRSSAQQASKKQEPVSGAGPSFRSARRSGGTFCGAVSRPPHAPDRRSPVRRSHRRTLSHRRRIEIDGFMAVTDYRTTACSPPAFCR